MRTPRPSIYRDALQVSPERIALMTDVDLTRLMGELLKAQAYKCRSPLNEIRVNTEGRASDDGCDGWSAKPQTPDDWLGSTHTCWQFKAGSAGQPARLAGEVTKRIPRETLTKGGRFIVVTSGSKNGKQGEKARLKKLIDDAKAAKIPVEQIQVIGSERLTNWCNQHPAIAAHWGGRREGLWTLEDWSNSDEHQVPWQALSNVQAKIDEQKANLDFFEGSVCHLHLQGRPGVGKTRFALELCRAAAWHKAVIYIRQASDIRLPELIDSAVDDTGIQLVVVADEVQPDQLLPLRDSIGRSNGRVRLITIGHSASPDPRRIPALEVQPLASDPMRRVIAGWYPPMPREHIDFVVCFADGYVRLARLAADAVARNPNMNVTELLEQNEIRMFLDRMLGSEDREALYVVAVLDSVGWTEDKKEEGWAIAQHLGLDWNRVQATVERFHRFSGIVPRGGRYRYISPTPLGIHLASEAWNTYPDLLRSLPGVLPSERAQDAYYDRLRSISSSPQARSYAREELAFFFRVGAFVDALAVRRWSVLSSADPDNAASNAFRALAGTSLKERRQIKDHARREMVWTLARLAWRSSSFEDAVKALALLAESENEAWTNNASNEFVARFQIFLGGTAVPYIERLSVIDNIIEERRPSLVSLAVQALGQVGRQEFSRTESGVLSDELPEEEWQPPTAKEHVESVQAALNKLIEIAQFGIADIQEDLVAAAGNISWLLRQIAVKELVAQFFKVVYGLYPQTREPLRKIIAEMLHREKKFLKEMTAEELRELESLHSHFEDPSLGARLHQFIGDSLIHRAGEIDFKPLAEEILSARHVLAEHWSWLTSGDATKAWWLGEALGEADSEDELAQTLPLLPENGRDLRLLCGYINTRRRLMGDKWYDSWMRSQFKREPKPVALLFEAAWRCGVTEITVSILISVLESCQVETYIVEQLTFGCVTDDLSRGALEKLLRAMVAAGHSRAAIGILRHRLEDHGTEIECWKSLALELVISSEVVRSGDTMTDYYWQEVAFMIVKDFPREIATAIFQEQVNDGFPGWFAEFTAAKSVLLACAERDPDEVWQGLQLYLLSRDTALRLSIGLPRGVLECLPADDILEWVAEAPVDRAAMMARFTNKDISSDETLASRILGTYGNYEQVASAFFGDYVSGTWVGSSAFHYAKLAKDLCEVAGRTALPKLRRWATKSAKSLRKMAERDHQREEEEEIGRR